MRPFVCECCDPNSDMKFRLTYEGRLLATQRDSLAGQRDRRAQHKHSIRREFHKQLRHLWATDRFLSRYQIHLDNPNLGERPCAAADAQYGMRAPQGDEMQPLVDVVADRHHRFGYRFVPLVTTYFNLRCSLHVLFLRHDVPGGAIQAGDIDNRIKALIDALRLPQHQNKLVSGDERPREGENPFSCLLEDDDQVSGFAVETDSLLYPSSGSDGSRSVKLVVTVELRPNFATSFNLELRIDDCAGRSSAPLSGMPETTLGSSFVALAPALLTKGFGVRRQGRSNA